MQTHGFPKVMGVLTHLDGFKDGEKLKKTKKALKHRFWTEIYQGADGQTGLIMSRVMMQCDMSCMRADAIRKLYSVPRDVAAALNSVS